ncbi:MAG: hypothetical protein EAZ57_04785 [Cytophagales bacterium]|nr:MAG: hypothetical protein EAZ57_04785 [Cytophagales bacterium]
MFVFCLKNYRLYLQSFVFAVFSLLFISANAQDLVVTDKGDSINCKIKKVDDTYIYFKYALAGERPQQSVLKLAQVKYYAYNFYGTADTAPDATQDTVSSNLGRGGNRKKNNKPERTRDYEAFFSRENYRLLGSVKAGGAFVQSLNSLTTSLFISGAVPRNVVEHYDNLRFGLGLGAECTYMYRPMSGLGIKLLYMGRSTSLGDVSFLDTTTQSVVTGSLVDRISIRSVGAHYTTYFPVFNNGGALYTQINGNVLGFRNKMTLVNQKIMIDAVDINFGFAIGIDYPLSQGGAIGLELSNTFMLVNSFTLTDATGKYRLNLGNRPESLARWELSLVYHLGLWKRS